MKNRVWKSRRGNALPIAIVTMFVVFALCGLLTSLALYSNRLSGLNEKFFDRRLSLDSVAQECRAALEGKNDPLKSELESKYGYSVRLSDNFNMTEGTLYEDGRYTIEVCRQSDGDVLLTVVYRVENQAVLIERYCYGALSEEESLVYQAGALSGE